MYIPVRSAGGGLAYKMPFIPMNAPVRVAIGPLCVRFSNEVFRIMFSPKKMMAMRG